MIHKVQNQCPLSGASVSAGTASRFIQLPNFPRMFGRQTPGYQTEVRILCDSCAVDGAAHYREVVERHISLKQLSKIYLNVAPEFDAFKLWRPGLVSLGRAATFLLYPDGLQLGAVNSVFKPDGGRCKFEFGDGAQLLLLALSGFARLEALSISLSEESDFELELRLANGSLLESDSRILDCQRCYQFRDHSPTQSMLFIFRSRNGNTTVNLKIIDLQGAFVASSVSEPAQEPLPAVGPRLPFVETKGNWEAETRTQFFEFKKLIAIRTIVFRVSLGNVPGS
jgi:hypothetical protein